MFVISRPINGISLNGREFVLNKDNLVITFESEEAAKKFLQEYNIDKKVMNVEGIDILSEEDVNYGC